MFETEMVLNQFLRDYLHQSVDSLSEEQLDATPINGFHSTRWILMHLAVTGDMGLVLLGETKQYPAAWHVAYGPKSSGSTHPKITAGSSELLEKIDQLYPQIQPSAVQAGTALLSQRHQLTLLKDTALQTNGHLLSHLLTTHFAVHLGQVSAIRRQFGFEPLF